jgi:CHAD domain-containing protein
LRVEPICELELELVSGPTASLFDLALALQESLPLRPAVVSKAERGFRLFLGEVSKPYRAGGGRLAGDAAPLAAFCTVAFDCIEHLQRNEAGLCGDNPEFLHQARVAIRRLRSAMRFWAPLLPAGFAETFDPAWQALAQTLGEQRNLDVFVGHTLPPLHKRFPDRPSLRRLEAAARRRQAVVRKAVRSTIEHPAYARLLLQFVAALCTLSEADEAATLPDSAVTLASFARQRLQRFAKTVRRRGEATGSDPEAHHRLRIAFKRLRYALEFCAPLFRRKRLRRYLSAASEMQEVLGDMNDLAVTAGIIADLRGAGSDPLLTGWFEGRAALLTDLLPAALAAFAVARPPWRKK